MRPAWSSLLPLCPFWRTFGLWLAAAKWSLSLAIWIQNIARLCNATARLNLPLTLENWRKSPGRVTVLFRLSIPKAG
jgi:hypothetical protein